MDESRQDQNRWSGLLDALLRDSHWQRAAAIAALLDGVSPDAALAELLKRLSRLDQLETAFAETLQSAKLDSLRELAYGASHEINNPLANISTRAQTLLRDETDPERRRMLTTINSQAFRAHEMISDMMLFAKPPDMLPEPVDLAVLVDQVSREIAEQASQQGTVIVRRGCDQSCIVSADPQHLSAALHALCRNSMEAIEMGGRITIGLDTPTESATDMVRLSVADTGPGIPADVRPHIFDPFYSGREAGRGLGFGLAKCWRIVTLHGGTIDVDSGAEETGGDEAREGGGARFTIQLPRAAPTMQATALAHR